MKYKVGVPVLLILLLSLNACKESSVNPPEDNSQNEGTPFSELIGTKWRLTFLSSEDMAYPLLNQRFSLEFGAELVTGRANCRSYVAVHQAGVQQKLAFVELNVTAGDCDLEPDWTSEFLDGLMRIGTFELSEGKLILSSKNRTAFFGNTMIFEPETQNEAIGEYYAREWVLDHADISYDGGQNYTSAAPLNNEHYRVILTAGKISGWNACNPFSAWISLPGNMEIAVHNYQQARVSCDPDEYDPDFTFNLRELKAYLLVDGQLILTSMNLSNGFIAKYYFNLNPDKAPVPSSVTMVNEADPNMPEMHSDDFTIIDGKQNGDRIVATVEYSGGCKLHRFRVVAAINELNNFVIPVYLRHDADGDECEAYIRDKVEFSIQTLRQVYIEKFGVLPATNVDFIIIGPSNSYTFPVTLK